MKWWLHELGNAWCAVTHVQSHEIVYYGKKVVYYHCHKCRRNWSESRYNYVNPKLKYTARGPSVLKGKSDVHEI